jgi:hypothetical protein
LLFEGGFQPKLRQKWGDFMLAPSPPRPPLCFRVGITGTREPQAAEAARPALAQILALVRDEICDLADTEEARVYHPEANDTIQPKFVFVSPLAKGADRVAAEEALRLGYSLKAVLPFAQAEYESDFPDAVDEFRWLLERADSMLVLDGDGKYRDRSYEAVGRFVVNNSDLLIAVWDGEWASGRGGTGDIVELAVDLGVPVVHLPIDGVGEVRLIETRLHLQADTTEIGEMTVDLEASEVQLRGIGGSEPRLIETWLRLRRPDLRPYSDALRRLIRRTVLPPPAPERTWFDPRSPALQEYWQEDVLGAGRRRVIFCLYDAVIWLLTKPADFEAWLVKFRDHKNLDPPRSASASAPAHGDAEEWWTRSYKPADKLSAKYGARYRSTYVIILISAFFALALASLALTCPGKRIWFSSSELAFLFLIAGFWGSDRLFRWHERWISYRLLAELCRKQRVLAPLGRSLPRWEIEDLDSGAIEHLGSAVIQYGADERDEAWVGWYFTAMARAAPFPRGDLRVDAFARGRQAGLTLLQKQIEYHVDRSRQDEAVGRALRALGVLLFLATLGSVSREIVAEGGRPMWSLFAAILPAASALFFGIRAYAEFEFLADQSAQMARVLRGHRTDLEEAGFNWPLASQDLGGRIFRAATLMMQDIRGWAQLFRVKHVETH